MNELQIIENKLDNYYKDLEENSYSHEREDIILSNILKLHSLKLKLLKQSKESDEDKSNLNKLTSFLNTILRCKLVNYAGRYAIVFKNIENDSMYSSPQPSIVHIFISKEWFDFLSNYLKVEER